MAFLEIPKSSYLHECFTYNKCTGIVRWKNRPIHHFKSSHAMNAWNARYAGKISGKISESKKNKTYSHVSINKKRYYLHRVIYAMVTGSIDPNMEIDHINGNGIDNRWSNLRLVHQRINARNHKIPSHNTSGICGVRFEEDRGLWLARITINKKMINLGRFSDVSDAIKARKAAEIKYNFHKNHGSDRPL